MMTDDEIIAVVQAHKEGKKIQASSSHDEIWHFCEHPMWAFSEFDYRVAPEPPKPREWWVHVVDGEIRACLTLNLHPSTNSLNPIRVREVIEGASSGNPTVDSDSGSSIP